MSQLRRHGAHGWRGPRVVTQHGTCAGTGHTVRTSEDKVRRKDLCGFVRAVYVLEKLPDVSGSDLVEARPYKMVSEPTLVVSQARMSQLRRHGAHG
jgi:hypothetical protein